MESETAKDPSTPVASAAKTVEKNHSRPGIWLRGMFMGMADVVPGFSGGTVALITGIYQRLITAISRIDMSFVRSIKNRQFRNAASHIDFQFLLTLVVGIVCGFVITLLTIHKLLDSPATRPFVLAAFFGMVIGSSYLVYQMVKSFDQSFQGRHYVSAIFGASIAIAVCLLPQAFTSDPPIWYVFICGMIAICAMILPGISGALILVILGCYKYLSDVARAVVHREDLLHGLTVSAVFGVGAICGLLLFSRLLKHLFNTRPGSTLAFLFGLMLGSVVKLWPFQEAMQQGEELTEAKLTRPIWPESFGTNEAMLLATAVGFAVIVWTVAKVAKGKTKRA